MLPGAQTAHAEPCADGQEVLEYERVLRPTVLTGPPVEDPDTRVKLGQTIPSARDAFIFYISILLLNGFFISVS